MNWMKVNEQMPETGVSVLATNGNRIRVAHTENFSAGVFFIEDGQDGYSLEDTTHWQSLPAMPDSPIPSQKTPAEASDLADSWLRMAAEARNKIKTREMAQHLIDRMEADLPHYNWLVAHRDSLPVDCGSGTVFGVCRKCGKGHGYPVSLRPNVAVRDGPAAGRFL